MREHTYFVDNWDCLLVETLRATSPIIPSINRRDVARYVSTYRHIIINTLPSLNVETSHCGVSIPLSDGIAETPQCDVSTCGNIHVLLIIGIIYT